MIIKNYDDIDIAIRQHKIIKESNLAEYYYYKDMLRLNVPSHLTTLRLDGMPGSKLPNVPLNIVLEKINLLESAVVIEVRAIKRLKKQQKNYIDFIFSLNGLPYLVAQMNIIEQLPLKEIADKLNYNYDYIRHLSIDIKKQFNLSN